MRYVTAWLEASGFTTALPISEPALRRFLMGHVAGVPQAVDEALQRVGVKRGTGLPSVSTLDRRCASIAAVHREEGFPNPFGATRWREILSSARRMEKSSGRASRRKDAAHLAVLDALLLTCDDSLAGKRDRAILLFGFSSGGRGRSEIAAATIERLRRVGDEFEYLMGPSKGSGGNDTGVVPVAGRAADALRYWIAAAGLTAGPLFRPIDRWGRVGNAALSGWGIYNVVKARATAAGLDASRYGAHSLRSGFVTEAGLQGIGLGEVMGLTFHRTVQAVAEYHRAGAGLANAAARLGR